MHQLQLNLLLDQQLQHNIQLLLCMVLVMKMDLKVVGIQHLHSHLMQLQNFLDQMHRHLNQQQLN
jgi:hypothetical protein